MKGNAKKLKDLTEGNHNRFIIPVYQRNYDWLIDNCNQLVTDLESLKNTSSSHFFGSIVTELVDDASGNNRFVIDGQQRLTTISLLLLAGIKAVADGGLACHDESKLADARDTYLFSQYADCERKIKLVPIDNDRDVYDRIFRGDDDLDEDSKLTRNFHHFYKLLTECGTFDSFDQLLKTINQLEIIHIMLDKDDDAQLIFESLNFTGLGLTAADKVRNFLLMSLPPSDQQRCYKNYWQKIEKATSYAPTMFLRDYLTIRQGLQMPVSKDDIYNKWKMYMKGKDRKAEMAQMATYAGYYRQLTTASLPTVKLSEKISHICNLETDIANVFFIPFLIYSQEQHLPESEILRVIDLVENYLARRIICDFPSNALTKVFCVLHRDVLKSLGEYAAAGEPGKYAYSDVLAYLLLRRRGKAQFPDDGTFREGIKTRNIYKLTKPNQRFLFERLENAVPGEYNDVVADMKAGRATIEHIMPQKLNEDWMKMLGPDYEDIHERNLHTFANLTLSGINSKLGNRDFLTKRDGEGLDKPGYKDSKYRLTREVTNCTRWTASEMGQRCQSITGRLLHLYPMPHTTFRPLPKPLDEVELDDEDFSPSYRLLKGFRLFGQTYEETSWKKMMLRVIQLVTDRFPDKVDALYHRNNGDGTYFKTHIPESDLYFTEVAKNRYVRTWMDNKPKIRVLRYLFDGCGLSGGELVLLLEKSKDESAS